MHELFILHRPADFLFDPRCREIGYAFRLELPPGVGQGLLDAAVQIVQLLKDVGMAKFQVFQKAFSRIRLGVAFRRVHRSCFLGLRTDHNPIGSAMETASGSLQRAAGHAEAAQFDERFVKIEQ